VISNGRKQGDSAMFAVIYIPNFALQAALRHEPELTRRAVALVDESLPKPAIVQLTAPARMAGVCAGLTSTQAMARCRDIIIKSRSPAQENAAADALLQSAYLFSPCVEATAPGVCTLDLKGQSHRGDQRFAQQILAVLDQLHLKARIGVAPTPAVALHAARHALECAQPCPQEPTAETNNVSGNAAHTPLPFLCVHDSPSFLSTLPIESLEPSLQLLDILEKWGIRNIGAFIALGKDALAERLGSEALELFQRASPTQTRPLKLSHPPEIFHEAFEFENEIESLEPLLFILRRFIEQIALRLALASFAAEEVFLRLILSDETKYERPFKIPAPTANGDVLFRILYTHLENLRTEHPIKALYLRATPCRPHREQFNLFDCTLRDPNHFYETLARLTALLGPDRVGIPMAEASHRPDAFRLDPVDFTPPGPRASARLTRRTPGRLQSIPHPPNTPRSKPSEPQAPAAITSPRCGLSLRRFRPPLPAQVELRGQRPRRLRSALAHGDIHRASGPWLSSGQWWDNQLWQRDEWDVQTTTGRLYRLFCEHGNWFLEGVYD
jgi:protein ImuB